MTHARIPKWLLISIQAISFLGFLDAAYLTLNHFLHRIPPCSLHGCEVVTTSMYSTIGPVPVALLGAIYYLIVLVCAVAYADTKKIVFMKIIANLTIAGFVASLYFVSLQLFVIKAICIYCMFSATTSTLLFISGRLLPKHLQ